MIELLFFRKSYLIWNCPKNGANTFWCARLGLVCLAKTKRKKKFIVVHKVNYSSVTSQTMIMYEWQCLKWKLYIVRMKMNIITLLLMNYETMYIVAVHLHAAMIVFLFLTSLLGYPQILNFKWYGWISLTTVWQRENVAIKKIYIIYFAHHIAQDASYIVIIILQKIVLYCLQSFWIVCQLIFDHLFA